ncbi:MAG: peptidylprolyl isomerase [Elusimicrobiota bacterium]|jgi:parvulin-like peptidyl-prolyl isomerase|nr:peptidylprolyl isomerase [Elusimicrobiota bacterium]
MNKSVMIIALAGLTAALSFACADKDQVVAKVGKVKITQTEIEARLANTPYQEFINTPFGKKQYLDWIVREAVLVESAKKAGIDKEKSYKDAVKDFKQQQARQLKEYETNLLVELYFRGIQSEITVTNEEIAAYYNIHKADFDAPVSYTVRHILVMDKVTADKAMQEIQSGVSFQNVAMEYSQDPSSAQNGGLMGPFRKGELVPEFEKEALSLQNDQYSGIIETSYGYHIIYKVSQKQLPAISFTDAAPEIKQILEREKFDRWFESKYKELGVKIDYNVPLE